MSIDLGDVCKQVEDSSRVAPLVVIPGDKLDEVVIESNACLDVEYGRVGIAIEISGDEVVLRVGQDSWNTD